MPQQKFTLLTLLLFFLSSSMNAQLQSMGNGSPSTFKKNFLKSRSNHHQKSTLCDEDTLYYAQYNAVTDRFINITPTGASPVTGVGVYFLIDDTVMLRGYNFYAYSQINGEQVSCKVYYAAADKRPAGVPIYTQSYTLNTGFTSLPWMYQNVTFPNPIPLVADFVITLETAGTATLVFASNDWLTNDGKGNRFSCVKFNGGWSNNITVGTDPFDADFYFEPMVTYKLTANFDHGNKSCIGNGLPFDFVNTTTWALNPQFSPEYIDTTLNDNFTWDYGDATPLDTALNGSHTYAAGNDYWVTLTADFYGWGNNCMDDTIILVEETNINANFTANTSAGLSVDFIDGSNEATQWKWDFGDGSNGSIKQSPTHVFNNYGTYQVKQIVRNKGCSDSLTLSVLVEPNGIEVVSGAALSLQVSPVPASDYIDLKVSGLVQQGSWMIYNIQGEIIDTQPLQDSQRVSLLNYRQGVYFVKATSGEHVVTKRFTVL